MTEDSGTRKSLLVGGVAFVVGSLLTLQILGPEVPKPEPRFVDASRATPPTAEPEPELTEAVELGQEDVVLDPILASTTGSATPEAAAETAWDSDLAPEASVFDAPEIATRSDGAQMLGLGQDPDLMLPPSRPQGAAPKEPEQAETPIAPPNASDALALLDRAVARTFAPEEPEQAEVAKALSEELVEAVNKGVSDAEIEALITDAVDTGKIYVPAAVFQVDGQVDTRALLLTLVEKAVDGGNSEAKAAVATIAESEPIFLRGRAKVTEDKPLPFPVPKRVPARVRSTETTAQVETKPTVERPETYVVRPGDSLAAIAFRFYGSTGAYVKIYQANRDQIFDPSVILVGQKLRIPG